MNKIELKREVKINCWNVLGTVGRPQKREYIILVLKIAETEGYVSSENINSQLLAQGRKAVAKRILKQCEKLKLLVENSPNYYKLTETGRRTLDEGKVYVQEDSQWRIWTTSEFLVPEKILKLEEIKDSKLNQTDQDNIKAEFLPPILKETQQRIINLPFGEIQSCTLDLKNKCFPDKNHKYTGILSIKGDDRQTEVYLKFENREVKIDTLPITKRELLNELMQNSEFNRKWNSKYNILLSGYEHLTDREKLHFTSTIDLKKPHHPEYGDFKPTQFDVQIYPDTQRDADKWADWFLTHDINEFVLNGEYDVWINKSAKRFQLSKPVFKTIREKRNDFVDPENDHKSEKYWYLSAGTDWNL